VDDPDEIFNYLKLEPSPQTNQHAVIVYFQYRKDDLEPLHALDHSLEAVIRENNVGKYDWHEIAMDLSDGSIYMYGPNAEALFKAVKPTLESTDFMKGAIAVLRFGPIHDNTSEIEIEIGVD
jgi:hypothetical protein